MISYTKVGTYVITLIITIIIYSFINLIIKPLNQISFLDSDNNQNQIQENVFSSNIQQNTTQNKEELNQETITWSLEIPSINLNAKIAEGTSKEVMDKYIGHFEETSKENGNIGLAAHNRGYPVNYFENIRKLKIGEEIIYKYMNYEKIYKVSKMEIIKDTNWSYLENTREENVITLITCVENQPEYRRCVQGVEER